MRRMNCCKVDQGWHNGVAAAVSNNQKHRHKQKHKPREAISQRLLCGECLTKMLCCMFQIVDARIVDGSKMVAGNQIRASGEEDEIILKLL